ncbi:MAG: tetratricopeptide repeat protein [Elusimicrobia bacterium]|nr:tetratricopeptide repeat protein [Elusimicrobiota bacterium]
MLSISAICPLFVFGVGLAVYLNTLGNDFVYDDIRAIVNNPAICDWRGIPGLFFQSYWSSSAEAIYRPLTVISFALNYALFGLTPWSFHLVNVVIHAINSTLVAVLLRRLTGEMTALMAALLFAVLPIHTEAVASIVGRAELLAFAFSILFWLTHSKGRKIWAAFSLAMALFSKENALVILPLVFLWEHLPLEKARMRSHYAWLIYAGVAFAWLLLRRLVLGQWGLDLEFQYFGTTDSLTRVLTMSVFAWRHYVWPMVTGTGLCADFSPWSFPFVDAGDVWGWLSLSVWITVLGFSIWLLFSWKTAGRKSLLRQWSGYWILWFLIGLAPVTNVFMPIGTIGAERFLYLPSLGFCVILAWAISIVFKPSPPRGEGRVRGALKLGILVFYYGALIVQRNTVWKNHRTLFEDTVKKAPNNSLAHSMLGIALAKNGEYGRAIEHFQRALEINPTSEAVYQNLANAYRQSGDSAMAVRALTQWMTRFPNNPAPRELLKSLH